MRKHYLDNLRWIVILMVVIFHAGYFYNNIGISAIFSGLPEFSGTIMGMGLYQYFVYPWFMLLLFVIAGMSARYALQEKTDKQFLKNRVDKLLVPSTLGVLAFGWIGGYIHYLMHADTMPQEMPLLAKMMIVLLSGIGALWFCHVLFLASLLLLLLRKILLRAQIKDADVCTWFAYRCNWIAVLIGIGILFWVGSHFGNLPVISVYRNGIYIPAFLSGYYIFSDEQIILQIKQHCLLLFVCSTILGIQYITNCYGLPYSDIHILERVDVSAYAFSMTIFLLGIGAKCLDVQNRVTEHMRSCCFGVYVLHIPVMLVINYMLIGKELPMWMIYGIECIGGLVCSVVLTSCVRRIPILRYWILGERKMQRYAKKRKEKRKKS